MLWVIRVFEVLSTLRNTQLIDMKKGNGSEKISSISFFIHQLSKGEKEWLAEKNS